MKYFLAAITAMVTWGFFSIPLRGLKLYPAGQILHFRIIFSLIFTWCIILIFRTGSLKKDVEYLRSSSHTERRKIVWLTIVAGVLITGNWYTFIYTINNVSLKSAAFAYMVCPLITALGGVFILKEKITTGKIIGLSVAITSIALLASGSFIDVLWSVFIASLYAFYLIIQRVIGEIDKLNMLGVQLIIATLIILPLYIYPHYSIPQDTNFWIYIILISVVFTVVPSFLILYALTGMASSTLGILIYLNPIVAFSVALFYFKEQVNAFQLLAYLLLFMAVLIFNWEYITGIYSKGEN